MQIFTRTATGILICLSVIPVFSFQAALPGAELYKDKCRKCHGLDGSKGAFGATNLRLSKLTVNETISILQTGRKRMPSFKKSLSQDQMLAIAQYVQQLKQ